MSIRFRTNTLVRTTPPAPHLSELGMIWPPSPISMTNVILKKQSFLKCRINVITLLRCDISYFSGLQGPLRRDCNV